LKKRIQFLYEANYSVSHDPTFEEKEIWIVLHGYGQLAEFFIRKFQSFDSPSRLFIAPEGTNYTYLEGFKGRVGANWMTRHEREIAIANNHRYLDQLMDDLLAGYSVKPTVKVLGFSQGAATATRWASNWTGEIKQLILWAGGFAEDLKLESASLKFATAELIMVIGNQDKLIQPESIEIQEELIKKLGIRVKKYPFEGGHELDQELLGKIFLLND
jgi:predicted esterase